MIRGIIFMLGLLVIIESISVYGSNPKLVRQPSSPTLLAAKQVARFARYKTISIVPSPAGNFVDVPLGNPTNIQPQKTIQKRTVENDSRCQGLCSVQ